MTFLKEYSGVVALVILAILNLAPLFAPNNFGATGTRFPNGISADSTSPTTGQIRGATLTTTGAATFNGNVTVTTSNAATSTIVVGCIQQYPTSTLTAVHLEYHASTTLANSTNGVTAGLVVWKYGACPA